MNYRELQKELKARNLSAFGNTETLKARLENAIANDNASPTVVVEPVTEPTVKVEVVTGEAMPEFVFVGDDGKRVFEERVRVGWDDQKDRPIYDTRKATKQVDPNNPARITMSTFDTPPENKKTYTFVLNGEPVQVDNDALATKLRNNHHFKEV